MVKIQFEGSVKRIYSETRGQYTSNYVVVEEAGGGKYANILRFKLKPDYNPTFGEGAQVQVSAYLDGREWANPQGQLMYFTDLKVDTIEVLAAGAAPSAAAPAAKPTTANDWGSLLALGTAYGENQDSIIAFCKKTLPGKASNAYTAADWMAVGNAIVAAHTTAAPAAAQPPAFNDDMPF